MTVSKISKNISLSNHYCLTALILITILAYTQKQLRELKNTRNRSKNNNSDT